MAREEMTSTPVRKRLEDKFNKNKIKQIKKRKDHGKETRKGGEEEIEDEITCEDRK